MIAFVVRDRAWRTLPPEPATVRQRLRDGGRWTVRARTPVGTGTLAWRLDFAPRERGIEVSVAMTAERDVLTNRAGLVVLLPAATFSGARFTARHGQGPPSHGRLPRTIAPHQPMVDLTSARIAAVHGPTLALAFEGETFEMEDQRNWLDPSFKLYGRSLSRPFPYRIRDGAHLEQRIRIDLIGVDASRPTRRTPSPRSGRLPALGIATSPGRVPTAAPVVTALREIAPGFVLHRTDSKGRGVSRASVLAASLGAGLRIEAFGNGPSLLNAVLEADAAIVAPYFTSDATIKALRKHSAATVDIGGTFADFVMLNRGGVAPDARRARFALCPTVHARDDRSLVETLDALPLVFAQARNIASGRPVDAGPCALRRRLVPGNGRPADRPYTPRGVPYDVDARQGRPIAAAWLAVVVAAAGAAGIDSVCAFEAAGARGLVGAHEPFPTTTQLGFGRRTPAHAVLTALGRNRRACVMLYALRAATGAAFAIGRDDPELWLVELAGRARQLPFRAARGEVARLTLGRDGASWTRAEFHQPLGAYGIARITFDRSSPRLLATIASDWCDVQARGASQPRTPRGAFA